MKSLFRYSGNKSRMLRHYANPPLGTTRIVEPYLGSGAYGINHELPCLGIDADPNIIRLWTWLQSIEEQDLHDLHDRLGKFLATGLRDIRQGSFTKGEQLYLKINVCGAYVGQWSSWSVYPQHSLPISETVRALPEVGRFTLQVGDAHDFVPQAGDALFVDPPYVNTSANYGKEKFNPRETRALFQKWAEHGVPMMITYGKGAPELFPEFPWQLVKTRLVPNLRKGGTVPRPEYVAYLNWEDDPIRGMFG